LDERAIDREVRIHQGDYSPYPDFGEVFWGIFLGMILGNSREIFVNAKYFYWAAARERKWQ
jgi:hypothetical protein